MNGFTFWNSFYEAGKELPEEMQGELYTAIVNYAFAGKEPEFQGTLKAVFNGIKPNLDLSIKRSKTTKKRMEKSKSKSDLQTKKKSSPANQNETLTCKPKSKVDLQTKSEVCSADTDTDTDSDTVTDTDTFIYIPPTPSKEGEPPKVEEMGYTPELEQTVKEWLAYKKEKRQGYKPQGLKTLLSQIKKNAERYGDKAVSDIIHQSMSSNYQGILWDRIYKARTPKTFPQRQYDYDMIEKKLLSEG